jgi:ParB family chromosome partitioning protein
MRTTHETPADAHSHDVSGRADGVEVERGGPDLPEASPVSPPLAVIAPTIPITALIAHPGNVRMDARLTADFVASVKAEGIRVPLLITETEEPGVFRIIDGHRRFAAARKAKLGAVPYTFDTARAADIAGQYLDMIITSRHKAPLTAMEEASALFAAELAGASTQRLVKAFGNREKVATALKAATLPKSTTKQVTTSDYPWSLDELAALNDFADDPDATSRLLAAADENQFAFRLRRELIDRDERRERARLRAEVEATGTRFLEARPEGARLLRAMSTPKGEDIDAEQHASCPGHAATFAEYSSKPTVFYLCTTPTECVHADREREAAKAQKPSATQSAAKGAARRLVIQGNKDWKAAEANRRDWLRNLLARPSLPRDQAETVTRWTAATYLAAPDPVASGVGHEKVRKLQAELLNAEDAPSDWKEHVAAKPARCLPLAMLAPLAACYERVMTDKTWRTDLESWMTSHRSHARAWLSLCQSLGHVLSPIEAALLADEAYAPTGPTPPLQAQADLDQDDEPDDTDEDDPAA